MKESTVEPRLRYPFHAWLLLGVTWCFSALVLMLCALFVLPCVPLAPVFVMIVIAIGGLLGSVRDYARSVATTARATTLRLEPHAEASPRTSAHGAPQAG